MTVGEHQGIQLYQELNLFEHRFVFLGSSLGDMKIRKKVLQKLMSVYECASLIYSSSSTPSQRCCFSPLRLLASGFMACRHLLTCQISTMRNCLPIFTMLWDPQMTGAFNCGPKATAGLRRQYHLLSPLLRNADSLSAVPSGIGV